MDSNLKSLLDDFQNEFPNAVPVADCNPSRHTPDTLDDARGKVATKLRNCKEYFENDSKPVAGKQPPDLVFKKTSGGKYAIGVKYGNRHLKNIFGANRKMLDGLTKEQMPRAFDKLIAGVEAKKFDNAIEDVMKVNRASRDKRLQRQQGGDDE